jgi:hypothetical protein
LTKKYPSQSTETRQGRLPEGTACGSSIENSKSDKSS